MIKFYGEYSENTKKYLIKKNIATIAISGMLAILVLLPISIYAAIVYKFWLMLIFLLITFLCVVASVLCLYIKKDKVIERDAPKLIEINDKENYLLVVFPRNHITTHKFTRIIKVIETEEWYILKLRFIIVGIRCQKDLLKEGTVEEFEEMFAGKIVRKERDEKAS